MRYRWFRESGFLPEAIRFTIGNARRQYIVPSEPDGWPV